jgi:hypothetical protein
MRSDELIKTHSRADNIPATQSFVLLSSLWVIRLLNLNKGLVQDLFPYTEYRN